VYCRISVCLGDDYPDQSAPEYQALKRLGDRLRHEYDDAYSNA